MLASPTTHDVYLMLIAVLGMVAVFAVMTVASWVVQRRLEREAFYRSEIERQLAERGELTADHLASIRAGEMQERWLQRRERVKLAGVMLSALGAGMLIAMRHQTEAPDVGWIPLAVGVGALIYAYRFYPPPVLGSVQPGPSDRASSGT